jgi:hypothetical protein
MPEPVPAPPAPSRARGRLAILLAALGVLAIALGVMRYRQLVAEEPSWSQFLERIRSGDVIAIQLGPTYAVVREGAGTRRRIYQVRYPAGVLGPAERIAIQDLTEERERQARRDELAGTANPAMPVSISGAPRPAWWRFW